MDYWDKLGNHVKLCKKNLLSGRVKCCASCPFEEQICGVYPELENLFRAKRLQLEAMEKGEK